MRHLDPDLIAEFASATRCECGCRCHSQYGLDAHHLFTRGAGQIDHRWNLISLTRECHSRAEALGRAERYRLLQIVAQREGTTPEAIEELVQRLRRMPPEAILCSGCGGHGLWPVRDGTMRCTKCEGNGAVMPDGGPIPEHRVRENP